MAKKRAARKPQDEPEGKVPFQVRFDAELHQRLKAQAEEAGCSLNDLVQGICWGVVDHLKQGEARRLSSGWVNAEPRKKCLYVGRPGDQLTNEEEARWAVDGIEPENKDKGELWFGLDFTGRGVVRG